MSARQHNRLEGTAMRTTTLFAIALTLVTLQPNQAAAHRFGHPTVPQNEFLFGLGWAEPRENSIFNIEFDSELTADLAYKFVFYHNTTDHLAFGIHFDWFHQDIDPLTVEDELGTRFNVFFDLDSYNLGPRVRYTFARGVFSPYWYLGMSYSFGDVQGSDRDFQRLGYDGFSVGTGIGTSVLSAEWLDISGEAFISTGWASWERYPFLNSTSRDFDPSQFGVLGNVTLRF
jgi:hypothetical protein